MINVPCGLIWDMSQENLADGGGLRKGKNEGAECLGVKSTEANFLAKVSRMWRDGLD